jgi:quercetin dioxygenase-like cupin family protein
VTYPPARYFGNKGEVTGTFRPAATDPDIVYSHGGMAHFIATGAQTNGQFVLYKWDMGPSPRGADPHFHRSFSESFYVLSGTIRIFNGDKWIDAVPGDYTFIPEGGIHAFRNESGEPASMLILFAPGAPREAYFEALPQLAGMGDEDKAELFRVHDQFNL